MYLKAQNKLNTAIKSIVNAKPHPRRIFSHPRLKMFKANKEPTVITTLNRITKAIIRHTHFRFFTTGARGFVAVACTEYEPKTAYRNPNTPKRIASVVKEDWNAIEGKSIIVTLSILTFLSSLLLFSIENRNGTSRLRSNYFQ
jgi:hypothetical protein